MRLVASLALVLLAASATIATAQSSSGSVFISGAAFAAIEKSPTFGNFGQPAGDSGGTVAGGSLGIGVHLTERVSARFEWSLTDVLRQSQDTAYPLYASGVLAPLSGGGTLIGLPDDPFLSIVPASSETKRTTAAGFALLGYHIAAARAAIEVVGGLGLLNTDVTTSYDVRIARGLGLAPTRQESTSSTFDAVAVVGADVDVSLTTHAAIVPHVRAYARSGGLSVRPGLALRWTF